MRPREKVVEGHGPSLIPQMSRAGPAWPQMLGSSSTSDTVDDFYSHLTDKDRSEVLVVLKSLVLTSLKLRVKMGSQSQMGVLAPRLTVSLCSAQAGTQV
jgi:hypothetical protein